MHSFTLAAAAGLFIALPVLSVEAQESVKDLAAKASAELRLMNSLQTIERTTSQLNHYLVYSIEAERGGWRVLEKEIGNDYAIRSNAERAKTDVARANNAILKSKFATEDELKKAASAVENGNILIELAPQIADLITAGQFDTASELYKEIGQPAHLKALQGAQSSVGTVQKRLGKTLLDMRLAK